MACTGSSVGSTKLRKEPVNLKIDQQKLSKLKHREKYVWKKKKTEQSTQEPQENIKLSITHVIETLQGKERERMSRRNVWRDNGW